MKFCFILVNYNNSKVTLECIDSIKSQNQYTCDIIVVDNNSLEEEKEILRSSAENDAIIIYLANNIGYFPAINQGLERAYSLKAFDFIIVGNNDLCFSENFIAELERVKVNSNVFVISPNIYTLDGKHQNPHFIHRPSFFRRFSYRLFYTHYFVANLITILSKYLIKNRSESSKNGNEINQVIYMGFGACYILTTSFMSRIKYLDNRVFLMGEEAYLANQIRQVDGEIMYIPALRILHKDHSTFNSLPSKFAYDCHRESYKIYKHFL